MQETPLFVGGFLVLTVAASLASHRWVEVPLHQRLRRTLAFSR